MPVIRNAGVIQGLRLCWKTRVSGHRHPIWSQRLAITVMAQQNLKRRGVFASDTKTPLRPGWLSTVNTGSILYRAHQGWRVMRIPETQNLSSLVIGYLYLCMFVHRSETAARNNGCVEQGVESRERTHAGSRSLK